ncbi:nitrate- and nitrite sensing domain-containing protein [Actinomadura vinacea]|uniref:nitrate- and nitrite sensing domain-containing protein n=1 Tax=Actinomadura vinacea TaxID=115336 RepID=UPI0031DFFCEF
MTTRLVAVIAIPTIVAAVLAGGRVLTSVENANEYRRSSDLATIGIHLSALSQALENERDAMAERAAGGAPAVDEGTLRQRQTAVDVAAREYRRAVADADVTGAQLRLGLANVDNRVRSLSALRSAAGRLGPEPIVDKYTEFNDDILAHLVVAAYDSSDPDTSRSLLTLVSLSRAKDAASRERVLIAAAMWEGRFEPRTMQGVQDARSDLTSNLAEFRASATLAELRLFDDRVTGPELDQAEYTRARVLILAGRSTQMSVRPMGAAQARDWVSDSTVRIDRMRQVETQKRADIGRRLEELRSDAVFATARDAVLLALLLAVVLFVVVAVARSMVRPLRRLQEGALEVAGTRLPGLVDRLRDPQAAADGIEVEPIDVDSADEIGQVARAFDEVHREAVRLAADEAVLRGNINAMFVNLSRRSQSLIERQLQLIEELEQSERDEDQLANLFRLDHLATRMRRNCENLLVLGGQDQVRRWNRSVPLIDVVRASLSEVEQYERVALRVHGDMPVAGPVVNDLVHLLAELVENATVFSAEHTRVTVSGQLLSGGGAMLQITDNGVGMKPDELEQANWRLANPPVIDFSAARRMGLFVVGRLAVRHGIRVELRAAQGGGLTAFVVLPEMVISQNETGVGSRGFGALDEGAGRNGEFAALAAPSGAAPGTGGQFRQNDGSGEYGIGMPRQRAIGGTGPQPVIGDDPRRPGPRQPAFGNTGPQPVHDGRPFDGPGFDEPAMDGPPFDGSRFDAPPRGRSPGGPRYEARPPYENAPYDNGQFDQFDNAQYVNGPYGDAPHGNAPNTTGPPPMQGSTGPHPPVSGTGPMGIAPPPDQGMGTGPQGPVGPGLPVRQPGAQHPRGGGPSGGEPPRQGGESGPVPGDPRRTGPLPVVPEAQPAVPETGPLPRVPWETGPIPVTPENGTPDWGTSGPGEHASAAPGHAPTRDTGHDPGQDAGHEPERPAAPGVPERSPIFDAMQSEWFQRRTDQTPSEDPVRGWESPADAGFKAAEAAQEPVAGKRTAAGLPKRVPGRNRVPGAVTSQRPAGGQPAQPAQQPQAAGQGGRPEPQVPAQSADTVRNRFASLQRGVRRGRTETRGADGPGGQGEGPGSANTGENPSQSEGENGGAR